METRGELPFPVKQVTLQWTALQCSRVLLCTGAHSLLAGSLYPDGFLSGSAQ